MAGIMEGRASGEFLDRERWDSWVRGKPTAGKLWRSSQYHE